MALPLSTLGDWTGDNTSVGSGVGATYPGGGVTSSASVKLQAARSMVKKAIRMRLRNFMIVSNKLLTGYPLGERFSTRRTEPVRDHDGLPALGTEAGRFSLMAPAPCRDHRLQVVIADFGLYHRRVCTAGSDGFFDAGVHILGGGRLRGEGIDLSQDIRAGL